MKHALSNPLLTVALVAGACWDAWRWYVARVAASPEEALALVLTIALVLASGGPTFRQTRRLHPVPLLPLAAMLGVYALAHAFAPSILLAAIAVTAALYALYRALFGTRPPLAFYGLVALALPVLPSLQFVLGYPLRVISASLTVALLQLQGLAAVREGTYLVWGGETVQFDAPCSGVNMLWAGIMLTLMACTVWRSGALMTAAALSASLLLTIAANVLRATSLFYVEAGLIANAAPWWHEAIGLAAFAGSAAVTLGMLSRLRDWEAARWAR